MDGNQRKRDESLMDMKSIFLCVPWISNNSHNTIKSIWFYNALQYNTLVSIIQKFILHQPNTTTPSTPSTKNKSQKKIEKKNSNQLEFNFYHKLPFLYAGSSTGLCNHWYMGCHVLKFLNGCSLYSFILDNILNYFRRSNPYLIYWNLDQCGFNWALNRNPLLLLFL